MQKLRIVARVFYVALALSFVFTRPAIAQLELLKDVNISEELSHNEYSYLTDAGVYMYYVSNHELWKSNGTTQYTVKMKAFTAISNLTMVGSTLFFTADDGISGPELWKSNGSPSSTVRVGDIVPGREGSSPAYLTNVNGTLFFAAYSQGTGTELWKSNGTSGGTVMVKDISRGSANPTGLVNSGGTLFFSATSPAGYELWKSDGTSANTVLVKDINTGIKSSNPGNITVSNNKVFFVALHPATGRELWITDGTAAGTQLVKDIRPGAQTSDAENLVHANGKMMFTAHEGIHGDELWSSDGTLAGTALVKDMNPGPAGSNTTDPLRATGGMGHFTNINGLLYFIASKGEQDYIYRSDGTETGTVIITEASSGIGRSSGGPAKDGPSPAFTYRNGHVYFFNRSGEYSDEDGLYRMPYRGKVISLVKSFALPENEWPEDYNVMILNHEMISFNGAVYFSARFTDTFEGFELIRSDGTSEGTVSLHDTFIPTRYSIPREMITVNGRVYMLTYPFLSYTPGLSSTDGTPEGTFEIRPERYHHEWEPVGNDLYFVEEEFVFPVYRWQLSKTQGTPQTTHIITYGENHAEVTRPKGLANVNGIVYYFNDLGEVWKTNGTAEGTAMIRDFYRVNSITNVEGQGFILAANENDGLEIWKTTSAGLVLVKTLAGMSSGHSEINKVTISIGGIFYFLANTQIWRSDGTSNGTFKMFGPDGFRGESLQPYDDEEILIEFKNELYFSNGSALYTVSENSYKKVQDMPMIISSVELNGKLYLFTRSNQRELYVTDGSPERTVLLHSMPVSNYSIDYAIVGDYLYFATIYTDELWRTDGTVCGTTLINVGVEYPFALEGLGNDLVFGGYLLATGHEPYVYHNVNSIAGAECEGAMMYTSDTRVRENILTPYPNPFTHSFTLKVPGNEGELAQVAVYTGTGMPVELIENIPVNTESSNIGAAWKQGFYIVRVRRGASLETYHVIKK